MMPRFSTQQENPYHKHQIGRRLYMESAVRQHAVLEYSLPWPFIPPTEPLPLFQRPELEPLPKGLFS